MVRRLFIVNLRRRLLAKSFAIFLIALALTPFTAPFSSFDAAEMLTVTSVHGSDGKAKDVDDVVDPACLNLSVFANAIPGLSVKPGDWPLTTPPPSYSPVLRI